MIKRYITALIGTPIIILLIIFGNKYVIDVTVCILALMAMYEIFKVLKNKYNPASWVRIFNMFNYSIYTCDSNGYPKANITFITSRNTINTIYTMCNF